jgi:hypothetical protein
VGTGNYTVQKGDCITSIASRTGHFWKTLWEHPDNAPIRDARKSPNILLPGDVLTVPPLRKKQQDCATDKLHKFVRKGVPARLRIRVMQEPEDPPEDGSGPLEEPRANQDYLLDIDGDVRSGTTDGDGWIDVTIPCEALQGKLTIGPDKFQIQIDLGYLDPEDDITGLQGRLTNLGYTCMPTGTLDEDTRAALVLFQTERKLEPTGEFDDATRAKLHELHQG